MQIAAFGKELGIKIGFQSCVFLAWFSLFGFFTLNMLLDIGLADNLSWSAS